jgi:hypothetical protein
MVGNLGQLVTLSQSTSWWPGAEIRWLVAIAANEARGALRFWTCVDGSFRVQVDDASASDDGADVSALAASGEACLAGGSTGSADAFISAASH